MNLQEIIKKLETQNYYNVSLIHEYDSYNKTFYEKIVIETDTETNCLKLLEILGLRTYNHRIKNHKKYYSITATILKD